MARSKPQLDENGNRKFGLLDKVAYGAGDFGCNMSFALAGTFFTIFYTQYMGIKAAHFAIILIILKVWDAINDPIMGGILDKARPDKTGSKYRRFILFGGIGLVAAAALCFIPLPKIAPNAAYWCKIAICVFGYLSWDLCYTIVNVPYGTMNAIITDKADERAALSTWRSLGAIVAQLPINMVLPGIVYASADAENANAFLGEKMFPIALILGIIGFIAFVFMIRNTVERCRPSEEEEQIQESVSWFKAVSTFFKNRAAVGVTLAAIFSIICMTGIGTATGVLFQSYFKNAQLSGLLSLISMIPMFLMMPFVQNIVKKFGKQNASAYTMLLGILVAVLMLVLPMPADNKGMILFMVYSLLITLSYAAFTLVGWAMVSDAIDYNEAEFGNRSEGTIYATYSMGRKIAQGVGPSLILFIMVALGYNEALGADQTAATAEALRYMIPAIYLVGLLGMFASLKFVYNLDNKTLEDVETKLRGKRDVAASVSE